MPAPAATPTDDDNEAFRLGVLRQLQDLTADHQRLLQAVSRSERRFRRLAKSVWHVQEEERRRLARELHDGLGQTLTALTNQLQRIHDDACSSGNLGLELRLSDSLAIARSALNDTRELSRLLRPTLLDDLGLDAALAWLARWLSERSEVRIVLESGLDGQRLHADVETLLFRITQEALTNVIRHSGARLARVVVHHSPMLLTLSVEDDGCGFTPAAPGDAERASESGGLRGMRDRAELFGGRVEIRSQPGQGTSVVLSLPLDGPDTDAPSPRTE